MKQKRPFKVTFKGEGAEDAGGPFRDALFNMCEELTQGMVPILRPSCNNDARYGNCTDGFVLNPDATDK